MRNYRANEENPIQRWKLRRGLVRIKDDVRIRIGGKRYRVKEVRTRKGKRKSL